MFVADYHGQKLAEQTHMQELWAPWRIDYINTTEKKQTSCIFCHSLKNKKKNYVFIKNKHSFAMLNLFPYNNGHTMISPNRHIGNLKLLTGKETADLFYTLNQVINLLDKILKPQGYNIGMNIGKCSGAGIPGHLHLHIVPRWQGDTNFMPIIAKTKVISQSLDSLYQKLSERIKNNK